MSTISASTTSTTAFKVTADTTGTLVFQTGASPTTAMTLGSDQSVTFAGTPTYSGGTANGVAYLNGSKVFTTGTALVFNGSTLSIDAGATAAALTYTGSSANSVKAVGTNTNSGTYFSLESMGATAYGVTTWQNGVLLEAVPASTGNLVFSAYTNSITFQTGARTERMRIDSSGNLLVGIQNTSPGAGNGNIIYGGADAGIMYMYRSSGTDMLRFYVNGSLVGRVTTTSSATSYVTSSDYRLKENVQPMQGALAKVAQLNPVTYTWKVDGSDGQGFIAHELQSVVPDSVVGEKDAVDAEGNPIYQGIDTSFLVATLTAAIQELNAKVEAQAAEIATLKGAA